MPFGKWNSFGECKTEMMGPPNNYNEETAQKVCGKLQARLEGKELFRILKSKEGRRIIAQYVHVEGLDKEGDIIPLTRTKEALDDLKARDPRTHNVMWRHTSYQIGWPLWNFTDEDGTVHKTEVDEYGLWGLTEIRNDGYQKADEVWNKILRGEPMGASIGITSPSGKMMPVILSKEEISRRGLRKDWLGARYWDISLQFIEPWSLTSTPANQYVTTAHILAKEAGQPKSDEERAKTHFGIDDEEWDELSTEERQAYINKLPPRTTGLTKVYIDKLKAMTWEQCIAEARKNPNVDDPEKLCGWLRAHGPNAKSKEVDEIAKSLRLDGEKIFQKYFPK